MSNAISVSQFKELMNLATSDKGTEKIISVRSMFDVKSRVFTSMEFRVDGHSMVCTEYRVAKKWLEKYLE